MKISVYARNELIPREPHETRTVVRGPALLLEGSWTSETPGCLYWSLDEEIDGRFEWIDIVASDLAEELSELGQIDDSCSSTGNLYSSANINVLALRYYLVKLARIVTYFTQVRPLRADDELEIYLCAGCDEDLADLFEELAARSGAQCTVRWNEPGIRGNLAIRAADFPKNSYIRRLGGRLARLVQPRKAIGSHRQRIVLCGNPRILDPIASELLREGCQLWWLYDRFAVQSWLRWRARGVGQLFCDSSLGRKNRLTAHLPERLSCLGINLAPAVGRWMAERLHTHGRQQTRAVREINAHFRRICPHRIVLSEDATPFARATVAVGRRHGATSFVVQHGVPCCRFGFAPLAADHLLAWGQSSKDQLVDWGVSPRQVHVTGSPQHEGMGRSLAASSDPPVSPAPTRIIWGKASRATGVLRSLGSAEPTGTGAIEAARELIASNVADHAVKAGRPVKSPKILLLATTTPRDGRPDSVAMHFNRKTHAQMLRDALSSVAKIEDATLEIKLHPRTPSDPIMEEILAEFESLKVNIVRKGSLETLASRADCILSCFSTAGVEAATTGVPVIQLLPRGSANIMPHDRWGLIGSSRAEEELDGLLAKVLVEGWKTQGVADERVFENPEVGATAQAVRMILEKTPVEQYRPVEQEPRPAELYAG
ncbi:MAG: hypothetical protein JXM70_21755 [Pirellulales bacterium]|nr:hypothetical protein [Pirellulales bacterium]